MSKRRTVTLTEPQIRALLQFCEFGRSRALYSIPTSQLEAGFRAMAVLEKELGLEIER